MRRRTKLVAVMVVLLFLAVPIPSNSASAPKAGGKCLKIGASVLHAGKLFTCIKSNGKLTWWQSTRTLPTPANQAKATIPAMEARSNRSIDQNPQNSTEDDSERFNEEIFCKIGVSKWFIPNESFIEIIGPGEISETKVAISEVRKTGSSRTDYYYLRLKVSLKAILLNKGGAYRCVFDLLKSDGFRQTYQRTIDLMPADSSPLATPRTISLVDGYGMGLGDTNEVGCFLENWYEYSSYNEGKARSTISLVRDDGTAVRRSGFWPNSGVFIKYLKLDWKKTYVGVLFESGSNIYGKEADRAWNKTYYCKYNLMGFNGETLELTVPLKMPPLHCEVWPEICAGLPPRS